MTTPNTRAFRPVLAPSECEELSDALVRQARAGLPLRTLLERALGRPVTDADLSVAKTQLDRLDRLPLPRAAAVVRAHAAQAAHDREDALAPWYRVAESLVAAALADDDAPLDLRSHYGIVGAHHQRAIYEAIRAGTLDVDGAYACVNNSALIERAVGGFAERAAPVSFRTVDAMGMPTAPAGSRDEMVAIRMPGDVTLRFLVGNEVELHHLAAMELDTVQWLRETIRHDSVLIDVGANIGIYSAYAAGLGDAVRVLAFEPSPSTWSRCVEHAALNAPDRMIVFPHAVGAVTGVGAFAIATSISGGWCHDGLRSTSGCVTGAALTSIDALLAQHDTGAPVTHLKVDIDGADLDVLAGATALLHAPTLAHVLIELDADCAETAKQLLSSAGFDNVERPASGAGNYIFRRLTT